MPDTTRTDKVDKFQPLRDAYAATLPQRIAEVCDKWASLARAVAPAPDWRELQRLVHTISGSAGIFGFHAIGDQARALEDDLETIDAQAPDQRQARIEACLERLRALAQELQRGAVTAEPEVLVVEDDLSILYLMQFILEELGYRVRSATDGKQGRLAIEQGPPARAVLVVLDITLPDEDGLQLLLRLRADPRWQQVPVLVLSALRDEETLRRAFAAGADDYLNKPFDPHQVADRIKRLAQNPRSALAKPQITS